jgi:4-amino-4-deoxy-L-arabinose transferase-like glycosyltransferase
MRAMTRHWVLLGAVLLGAAALRFPVLDRAPPGVYTDEAAIAVNVRSLRATGRDQYGERLPVFFRALDDYKAPLFIYSLVPWSLVAGDDVHAARAAAAAWGVLGLLGAYWLALEVLRSRRGALLATALLAVCPWHLQYSRMAWQAITLVTLHTFAAALLLRASRRGGAGHRELAAGGVLLAACLYTYSPAKLWVPLLTVALAGAVVVHHRAWPWSRRATALALGLAALTAAPYLVAYAGIHDRVNLRFQAISVLGQPGAAGKVVDGYLRHLSPSFLFLTGDPILRHSAPGIGQLLWPEILLLPFGLWVLARGEVGRQGAGRRLLVAWIFAAPVLGALTQGGPHATRVIALLPATAIASAAGVLGLLRYARQAGGHWTRTVPAVVAATLALSAGYTTWSSVHVAPRHPDVRLAWHAAGPSMVNRARTLALAHDAGRVHFLPYTQVTYVDWLYLLDVPPETLHAHAEVTRGGAERYDPLDSAGRWSFCGAAFRGSETPGPGELVVQAPGDHVPREWQLLDEEDGVRYWLTPRTAPNPVGVEPPTR